MSKSLFFFWVLVICSTSSASARVWTVETDGSGDFADLQSASDAAASGDTILVGEGRFGEPGWSECLGDDLFTIMAITQESIVILGEGDDRSIIGPETPWSEELPFRAGITAVGFCGTANLIIKGIGFENLTHAVHCEFGLERENDEPTSFSIENCEFRENYVSLFLDAHVNNVSNCTNFSTLLGASFVESYLGAPLRENHFRNCQSDFTNINTRQIALGGEVLTVDDCDFSGGSPWNGTGITTTTNRLEIRDSLIMGDRWGVIFRGRDISISGSQFFNLKKGVWLVEPDFFIEMESCVFSDIQVSSISYCPTTRGGVVRGCNLSRGAEFTVSHTPYKSSEDLAKSPNSEYYIDMTHNFWETDDPDSIRTWIEDGADDDDWPYFILWKPFLENQVEANAKSLGDVKALFR